MLFYGKEINFFYIIVLVILILVVYILFSFYTQQKQSILMLAGSTSIQTPTSFPILSNKINEIKLDKGAFAISLWLNIDSWIAATTTNSLNILTVTNTPSTFFSLNLDNNGRLNVNTTNPTNTTPIIMFPIREPVNIILNYNGDDDYNEDETEYVYDSSGNKQPIYNSGGFQSKNRALDVYINGRLNNTIILDTLTGTTNSSNNFTYTDASMNYIVSDGNNITIGDVNASSKGSGTISNCTFIKNGCSTEDAKIIFLNGKSGSILDNIFAYKLRFSLLEDNQEVKTYDI